MLTLDNRSRKGVLDILRDGRGKEILKSSLGVGWSSEISCSDGIGEIPIFLSKHLSSEVWTYNF